MHARSAPAASAGSTTTELRSAATKRSRTCGSPSRRTRGRREWAVDQACGRSLSGRGVALFLRRHSGDASCNARARPRVPRAGDSRSSQELLARTSREPSLRATARGRVSRARPAAPGRGAEVGKRAEDPEPARRPMLRSGRPGRAEIHVSRVLEAARPPCDVDAGTRRARRAAATTARRLDQPGSRAHGHRRQRGACDARSPRLTRASHLSTRFAAVGDSAAHRRNLGTTSELKTAGAQRHPEQPSCGSNHDRCCPEQHRHRLGAGVPVSYPRLVV